MPIPKRLKPTKEMIEEEIERKFDDHELSMSLFELHIHGNVQAYKAGYKDAASVIRNRYRETPVTQFHKTFGHPVETKPTIPSPGTRLLRVKLLLEEVLEFATASGIGICTNEGLLQSCEDVDLVDKYEPNLVEAADALGDIRVVTDGGNLAWGFPGEKILYEIHDANMSKLGEDGKPIYREDGKIGKGPNTRKPNLEPILIEAGWEKEDGQ